jgi:hypothetical protein
MWSFLSVVHPLGVPKPTVCLTSTDNPLIGGALFLASAHAIDSIFDNIPQFTG